MSQTFPLAVATCVILCTTYWLRADAFQVMGMGAIMVASLIAMDRRLRVANHQGANEATPLGEAGVVKVDAVGPDAFLLSVRTLESGEPLLFLTGACLDPSMVVRLGPESDRDLPAGCQRVVFELDGQTFALAHRRARRVVEGLRSGGAVERLRTLAAFGRPGLTIENGRLQARLAGSSSTNAREALVAFARAAHALAEAAEPGPDGGAYR